MKHAGQKSVKEELPERRKGPKRAIECRLKVPTHVWEQDAGSSSLPTRTIFGQKNRLFGRFFFFLSNFLIEMLYFTSYGLLLLVRPRI